MFYSEQERQVYTCAITGRKYDPLAVKRALIRACNRNYNAWVEAAGSDDSEKADNARGSLTDAARKAFALAPIDPLTGEGVVDAKVYDALIAFTKYLSGKGERARTEPSSAPCSGCP